MTSSGNDPSVPNTKNSGSSSLPSVPLPNASGFVSQPSTLPQAPLHPMMMPMYFYQPFMTAVPSPQGYPYPSYPPMYPPQPYQPIQYSTNTTHNPAQSNKASNINIPSIAFSSSIRPPPQKKPNIQAQAKVVQQKPHAQTPTQVKLQSNSIPVSSYNLDDPEELEKWKAERRKKFPKKVSSEDSTVNLEVKVDEINEIKLEEESLKVESVEEKTFKSKRYCKYFSRGKCHKADQCPFEHSLPVKRAKTGNNFNLISGNCTVFENLLKIEERDSLLKFYDCIKLIISNK